MIAAVGRVRTPGLRDTIHAYERRASRYFRLKVVELPSASLPDSAADRARAIEETALLGAVPDELEITALTRQGELMDSRALAAYLEEMATYARPGAAFLLGGAHGLSAALLDRSRRRIALSRMTLPHEIARLVLVEQLYRAGTILRGEPYHKGT